MSTPSLVDVGPVRGWVKGPPPRLRGPRETNEPNRETVSYGPSFISCSSGSFVIFREYPPVSKWKPRQWRTQGGLLGHSVRPSDSSPDTGQLSTPFAPSPPSLNGHRSVDPSSPRPWTEVRKPRVDGVPRRRLHDMLLHWARSSTRFLDGPSFLSEGSRTVLPPTAGSDWTPTDRRGSNVRNRCTQMLLANLLGSRRTGVLPRLTRTVTGLTDRPSRPTTPIWVVDETTLLWFVETLESNRTQYLKKLLVNIRYQREVSFSWIPQRGKGRVVVKCRLNPPKRPGELWVGT